MIDDNAYIYVSFSMNICGIRPTNDRLTFTKSPCQVHAHRLLCFKHPSSPPIQALPYFDLGNAVAIRTSIGLGCPSASVSMLLVVVSRSHRK
jgi:hypothetical protein